MIETAFTAYLNIVGERFPRSKWAISDRDTQAVAILDLDILSLRLVLFNQEKGPFPLGAVSLTLHAGKNLIRRYGPTKEGKQIEYSMTLGQFAQAVAHAQEDLLGVATGIFTVTESAG